MELYDKFVISSYEPQSSRVLWIDADKHEIKAFINGKWESCGGGGGSTPELVEEVNRILSYIPAQASADNKLTDTNFVNSSIATNTATFRGTSEAGLTEEQFLTWANSLTKDNNDYIFWNTTDSDGNTIFKRYKYNGTTWSYEYSLNNSSFTAAQWAAIQSGITAGIVQNLHDSNNLVRGEVVHNIVVLTQAQYDDLVTKDANTEYNII